MNDPGYTPPLSLEGWLEIEDESVNGSPMTPERRAMFELVRAREAAWENHDLKRGRMNPYRRTPPLTPEGAAEIIAEMESPPADTPERRATFERMRQMEEVHRRSAELEKKAAIRP